MRRTHLLGRRTLRPQAWRRSENIISPIHHAPSATRRLGPEDAPTVRTARNEDRTDHGHRQAPGEQLVEERPALLRGVPARQSAPIVDNGEHQPGDRPRSSRWQSRARWSYQAGPPGTVGRRPAARRRRHAVDRDEANNQRHHPVTRAPVETLTMSAHQVDALCLLPVDRNQNGDP